MREWRECTAYSRGVKGEEELEEAVSFCAASDKSRGRGRGRFAARRVRVLLLLWLERLSERREAERVDCGFTGKRERRCLG
jgi:hypothetical protein